MPRNRVLIAVGAISFAAVIFAGAWFMFLRDDAPPPVDLEAAIASALATPRADATSTDATASATAEGGEEASGRAPGELVGTWGISGRGESFVGYRVQEQLSSIGANTAVGRTDAVEASLEFDGTAITSVVIAADLTQLVSDDSRRDGQLRRRGLETNAFPTSTFVLTEPIVLDGVPEEGVAVTATAIGDFTLHGITRQVEIEVEGQLSDGLLVVVGSHEVVFADYDITNLTGFLVLSTEDHGTLEFQLVFE